jgi:hypothetical protein
MSINNPHNYIARMKPLVSHHGRRKQQQQETSLPEKYPNMATKIIKMHPFENWTWPILGTARIGHTYTTE